MAYTGLPALLASIGTMPQQYTPGSWFRAAREQRGQEEELRAAKERERLQEQGQLLNAEQSAAQLGLQRRGQDLETGRYFAQRQAEREAAAQKRYDEAQGMFEAADVQGDEAAREVAMSRLRGLGANVERVDPYQAPVPRESDRPEAEALRRKIAVKAVDQKLTPQARQQLMSAEDVVLTPSKEAAQPALRPGGWRVQSGAGQETYRSQDTKTTEWRNQALNRAFAQYEANPDPEYSAIAKRAKEFSAGEMGTKPLPAAIDAGMAAYQAEVKNLEAQRRAKVAAGRPQGGTPGGREKTAWSQIQQVYQRTGTQYKFAEAQSTEADLKQSLGIVKQRTALGDTAAATQLAKSLQSGVLSNQDVNMIMDPSFMTKLNNTVGYYLKGGLRDDEFMRQVEEMVYSGLKKTNDIRTRAALQFRQELDSPLLDMTPQERQFQQDRGFEWFAGVPWSTYQQRQQGRKGAAPQRAPARGAPAQKAPSGPPAAKPSPKPEPKMPTPSAKPGKIEGALMDLLK